MSKFFTADWHLFHSHIMEYCKRPYTSAKHMHQQLAFNHNQLVTDDDEVWNVGDLCFMNPEFVGRVRKEVERFRGKKHLVLGNHDEWKARNYTNAGFITVHTAMWFKHDDYTFYMMHDPAEYTVIQNDPKAIMLCGHIHQLFQHLLPERRIINVGVDAWDYNPVSFATILDLLKEYKVIQE